MRRSIQQSHLYGFAYNSPFGTNGVGSLFAIFCEDLYCMAMAPTDVPAVGDRLYFRYPDALHFRHGFYTSWPGDGGAKVGRETSEVDLRAPVDVQEVVENIWRGSRWVAIRFSNPRDGKVLWTNYSRDDHVWMVPGSQPRPKAKAKTSPATQPGTSPVTSSAAPPPGPPGASSAATSSATE